MGFFNRFFEKKVTPHYSPDNYNEFFEKNEIQGTKLESLPLGDLHITSGKIVACDPLTSFGRMPPFTREVPPGLYPVIARVANMAKAGERFGLVKMQFSIVKAVKWELARQEGDNKELKGDEFVGFPVDAGLGCFMDRETNQAYLKFAEEFLKRNPDANLYDDFFAAEFKKNIQNPDDLTDIGNWLNFSLPDDPSKNVVVFSSGFGDGIYPCYWGIGKGGELCELVADFFVMQRLDDKPL